VLNASEILGRVPLFAALSPEDRVRLSEHMKETHFGAGDVIVREGTRGARVLAFFVIADGTASVTTNGTHGAPLSAGDFFGEIGLLLDAPRSATVTAETSLTCYALSAWDFRSFVDKHPDVEAVLARTLEARLNQ
jgi:CRP-like cAMP-binding protein